MGPGFEPQRAHQVTLRQSRARIDTMDGLFDEFNVEVRAFAEERDWRQFHTPRSLILALVGEVGELAEVLQWIPDAQSQDFLRDESNKKRFSDELADVLIYLTRLADEAGVDLIAAARQKIRENSSKYPIEKAYGNAKKYTQLGND